MCAENKLLEGRRGVTQHYTNQSTYFKTLSGQGINTQAGDGRHDFPRLTTLWVTCRQIDNLVSYMQTN